MMSVAFVLVRRQIVIDVQAIRDEDAAIVSDQGFGLRSAARGDDAIAGSCPVGQNPQAEAGASDPPARLVRMQYGLALEARQACLILGPEALGYARERLGEPAGAQAQPDEFVQNRAGLAHRQAEPSVEGGRKGKRPRTELGSRRPTGETDLKRMAGGHVLPA